MSLICVYNFSMYAKILQQPEKDCIKVCFIKIIGIPIFQNLLIPDDK